MYDYLVCGAGPSGIYTALRLEQSWTNNDRPPRILILETRGCIGGRTRQVRFHSQWVSTGAGVGRYEKDLRLRALVERMDGSLSRHSNQICYQMDHPVDTLSYVQALRQKKEWIRTHRRTHSFRDLFLHFYPPTEYIAFCQSNGYTDFERADMVDTLEDYGFEDNQNGSSFFSVPWNRLLRDLRRRLRYTRFQFHQTVKSFQILTTAKGEGVQVDTKEGGRFFTRKLIYAGFIDASFPYEWIHRSIGSQPFLRLYAFLHAPDPLRRKSRYTEDSLQKSIVLTPRVLLLSYSDNERAQDVRHWTKAELEARSGVSIQETRSFYWEKGTHFYFPLDTHQFVDRDAFLERAQHPEPPIFLVGEIVSRNQGWTEGALESVERILHFLI